MKIEEIDNLDWEKSEGLLPAIVQDAETLQVLMLGYMNQEAFEKTLETKRVTFFSRSKKRIWVKGETSKNYFDLVDIVKDCDSDALLVFASPQGPACHQGSRSCFDGQDAMGIGFLQKLWQVIDERYEENAEGSYTIKLFSAGIDRIAQKLGEEAVEMVVAAKNEALEPIKEEAADLIYHLLVLLRARNITLLEVVEVLRSRHLQG